VDGSTDVLAARTSAGATQLNCNQLLSVSRVQAILCHQVPCHDRLQLLPSYSLDEHETTSSACCFIYLFIYFSESTVFEFSTLEALPHYKKAAMLIALMNFQKVRNE